jgi:hypothetical protein
VVIRLTLFYQLLLLSILIVFYIIFLRELFILSKSKFAIQRKPSFFYIIEIVLTLFSLFKSDGLHDTVMLGWQRGCEMMAFEHFG